MKYRLIGSQDPASRIDRVEVSKSTVIELGGDPVTLSDKQVSELSAFVQLQPENEEEGSQVAEYGPENYPDPRSERSQSESSDAPNSPEEEQPVSADPNAPEPQPEPQQVSARPRARKEA